jgi:hypothetical protein
MRASQKLAGVGSPAPSAWDASHAMARCRQIWTAGLSGVQAGQRGSRRTAVPRPFRGAAGLTNWNFANWELSSRGPGTQACCWFS